MNRKQKGSNTLVAVIIIAVIIAVAGVFFMKKNATAPTSYTGTQSEVQNTNLNTLSSDLDTTDIDSIDTDLNQLNSDASTF